MGKKDVLEILKVNSNEVISGGKIASELGITRNAVWKHINNLKKDGYNIKSLNNRGYVLEDDSDFLLLTEINNHLKNPEKFEIEIYDEIDSTNNYLKRVHENERKEGKVAIANCQTGGRGRMGRSFESPKNAGLYFSFILKPKLPMNEIYYLTILSAVAMSEAINEQTGLACGIKWVNDLYIKGRKLCGILTEGVMTLEYGSLDYTIIGIGLNVNRDQSVKYNDELNNLIGYLSDFTDDKLSRNNIFSSFMNIFFDLYERFDLNEIYQLYKNSMLHIGSNIIYKKGNEERKGILLDLNKDFSIKIKDEDGSILNCSTGEIRIRKDSNKKEL